MRHKLKNGKLGAGGKAKLDEYDAARARGEKPPSSSSPPDQQPAPETAAGDGAGPVGDPPPSGAGAAPSADDSPLPSPEAPPKVKIETAASSSSGAWQDKYKKVLAGASADGREMLCTMLAGQFLAVMESLATDIRSVPGKEPVVDPKALYPLYVLGFDQLLPDRARLTPGTAAVVGSGVLVGQRVLLHKEIVAAQKEDPSVQRWKREQAAAEEKAKAERAERAERVAKAAEQGIKPVEATPIVVETAEPPSSPAPVSLVHMPNSKTVTAPAPAKTDIRPDGKLLI